MTIFPIPKANFSTAASLPCDYLLVHLSDIVTILPSSRGSRNIRYRLYDEKKNLDPSLLDEPGEGRVHHLEVEAAVGVDRDEGGHRHALAVDRRLQVEVCK